MEIVPPPPKKPVLIHVLQMINPVRFSSCFTKTCHLSAAEREYESEESELEKAEI